jgi:hypothetical protein
MVKEGYYDFLLVSNYGTKIFLGNTLIIENKGFPSVESIKSFVLPLEKGFYPVRIEYVQKDKNNVFRLYYIGPETKNAAPFPLKYQYYKK